MTELTERQICDQLYKWQKEGALNRNNGKPCPYKGNTIAHMMHSSGWLTEDLRIALIKADPKYAASQRRL